MQIRKPDVAERLRSLAQREGLSITDLVDEMARDREARANTARQAEIDRKIAAAEAIVAHFQSLPILGPLLTDDDFYDEDGLPK
ncbi:type II toxin-antitoxin system VapB family antitoxin [Brevundimonas sp.]|uniref:type II toxin-antitoxin system VapB family antitoxin n=1 Tax=Brevundimonas sp. TaxID=1871086 RepID=UPI003D13B0F4